MEARSRITRNYETQDGREPFEEWFRALKDKNTKACVLERINRVRLGNFGDCRSLGEGMYELRIHYGPGYRIYLGDLDGVIVILLCGGSKRTQRQDINTAREHWKELKGRTQ